MDLRTNKRFQRKHGQINRLLTEALRGRGVFNTYLHVIGKVISDECSYCGEEDTLEQALWVLAQENVALI